MKDNPQFKRSDLDFTVQILELEQEIYAEEAKAYLCQYGIADKNKSEVLAKQIKILERARVKLIRPNADVLDCVPRLGGMPIYNADFINNKGEAMKKIKDTRQTIDEALTIIY